MVGTPIGNLNDITLRALAVLRDVDVILAEDTRRTRVLLQHFGIRTPLRSFNEHSESRATGGVIARLTEGATAGLVSDAGTPLISDPGAKLVSEAWKAGIRVVPIPGPSALITALSAAGIDTDRFTFVGFLDRKGRSRAHSLRRLSVIPHTSVVYESPERLARTLGELVEVGAGDRTVVVARELTKRFEEFRRGTAASLATYYASSPPRGEVVVIIEGSREEPADPTELQERVRAMRESGLSRREVQEALVEDHGVPRNTAYKLAHDA